MEKNLKGAEGVRRAWEGENFIFLFPLFAFFLDLRKSDRRFSSGLKAKLIYATKTTRGHQNLAVSSNSPR